MRSCTCSQPGICCVGAGNPASSDRLQGAKPQPASVHARAMALAKTSPGPELLDDLCSRFILNVPPSELESFEKFMFLVEQAHWFYEVDNNTDLLVIIRDFCRDRDQQLKSLSLKEFTGLLFGHCPGLTRFRHMLDAIYNDFNRFKQSVPTMGALLLEPKMEKVLLVRGFSASHGWGFPKGKVAKDESDVDCAIREVREETGLDITSRLNSEDFIEVRFGLKGDGRGQQRCKLFIVQGIEESTRFSPTVKGEIGGYGWYVIEDLPASSEAARQTYLNDNGGRHRFHLIHPFVKQLRSWIRAQRRRLEAHRQSGRGKDRHLNGRTVANQSTQVPTLTKEAPQVAPHELEKVPGQAWRNFRFERDVIMEHLASRLK